MVEKSSTIFKIGLPWKKSSTLNCEVLLVVSINGLLKWNYIRNKMKARIVWLTEEQGGRKTIPYIHQFTWRLIDGVWRYVEKELIEAMNEIKPCKCGLKQGKTVYTFRITPFSSCNCPLEQHAHARCFFIDYILKKT